MVLERGLPVLPVAGDVGLSQPISNYKAGEEIYAQGEKADTLYQVAFGCVRVYRLLADGRRQISAFHLAGDVFGFENDETHHFFAEAVSSAGLRSLRKPSTSDAATLMFPFTLRSLVRAQEHLLVLGRQTALERIAAFLLDLAERQGGHDEFEMPMPRNDIADYLGLTIETVSRSFSELKRQGLIQLNGLRQVELLCPQDLKDMCC
ncbi:helix-turn-helix domain-containing protein [Radicibacter daui]|uniref:helix-turn-helix domain-containing protein n=1 Tax=Radicibacter daui TaxID=3064829 RepID=UPI004046E0DD